MVEGAEASTRVAAEDQAAAGGDDRVGRGLGLEQPLRFARHRRDRVDRAEVLLAGRQDVVRGQVVDRDLLLHRLGARALDIPGHQHPRALVAQRVVHRLGQGAVGAGLPVLAAGPARAHEHLLLQLGEDDLGVLHRAPRGLVDVDHHVLRHRRPGPEELARFAVQRVDEAGLAGDSRHHFARLSGLEVRPDPAHRLRIGRHREVDQDPLEGMIQIPVVVQVLEVPPDLAGVGLERQGRVVVEVGQLHAAEHELRRRRGDGGAEVDEFELRVVAGHHPGANVAPLFEGHVAPGLVAGLAGRRHGALPPEFLPGQRVERDHDAGFRAAPRPAAPSGNHPAAGDDRTRTVRGGIDLPVQDLRLPDHLAGLGVQREGVVVVAVVQDQPVVDRDVPVVLRIEADLGVEAFRQLARVAPDEVAGHRVHRLDHVVDRGNVEHAVIRQGSDLGRPHADFASPDQAQPLHVRPVDLVQGAVAPTVQRPAEHQPLRRRRVLEHLVRDGHERRPRRLLG